MKKRSALAGQFLVVAALSVVGSEVLRGAWQDPDKQVGVIGELSALRDSFVGVVVAWPSQIPIPAGWSSCDGSAIKKADHERSWPRLLKVRGVNGDNNEIRMPDLKGYFLRGKEDDREVLSRQEWATAFPKDAPMAGTRKILVDARPNGDAVFFDGEANPKQVSPAAGIGRGWDLETRPKNVAVVWIMRTD